MPRVTPVSDKSQVAPEFHHVADEVLKVFGSFRGPHSILMLSPKADEPAGADCSIPGDGRRKACLS